MTEICLAVLTINRSITQPLISNGTPPDKISTLSG
jgi:hypothetical protein